MPNQESEMRKEQEHETVEERFAGSLGRVERAQMALSNASYTEIGHAGIDAIGDAMSCAHDLAHAAEELATVLERAE
jgi:hypothetical protein